MSKKIIIVRGLPGSGKTTFLKNNFPDALICSATLFFMENGEYNFDKSKLRDAHDYCYASFGDAIESKVEFIAIDNTNIKAWEFDHYLEKAAEFGYDVIVYRMNVRDINAIGARNIHNVPDWKIYQMHLNLQDYDGEILIDSGI